MMGLSLVISLYSPGVHPGICKSALLGGKNAEQLQMVVPVGNLQHVYLVTFLTFAVTAGGSIYILSVLANSAGNIL